MLFTKHVSSAVFATGLVAMTLESAVAAEPNAGPGVPGGIAPATASGDRWAVIGAGCVFSRGKGVVSVLRGDTATGSCVVRFNMTVTGCVYNATIGLPGISGTSPPGFVTVVRRNTVPQAVYVELRNSGAALADLGFHLVVGCG